jgi:hypothetical protein
MRAVSAMTAGRDRWVAKMRELKQAGVIEKIPGGRRAKAPKPREGDKVIHRARAIVASEGTRLPAMPKSEARDWGKKMHADKLRALTGKALDKTKEILELACDPDNLKLLSIQKDAALSIIAAQVKVDETQLRARDEESHQRALAKIRRRLEEYDATHPLCTAADPNS